uniref:Calmodulin-binding transcription activator 3 isoform X2 n=1 Tax=Rhizophora mucronata TaxID=61149 RepID=A0A2P2KCM3_RHIMU
MENILAASLQLFMSFSDSFSIFFLPPTVTIFTKIPECFPIEEEQRPSCRPDGRLRIQREQLVVAKYFHDLRCAKPTVSCFFC